MIIIKSTKLKRKGGKISLNPSRTYKDTKPAKDEVALNPSRTYKDKIEKPAKGGTNPRTAPSGRSTRLPKKP